VNRLDLLILAGLVVAAIGGWRLGFVNRLFAWIGVFVALAIGAYFVPGVVTELGGSSPGTRALAALGFLVFAAAIGQAVGLGIGLVLNGMRPPRASVPLVDRIAGAAVGALGLLVIVWMAVPSLASARGWTAEAARDSVIVDAVERVGPERPEQLEAWARYIAEAPLALAPLVDPPDPGVPPRDALPRGVDAHVRPATVLVTVDACDRVQQGSGFVAGNGLVVTNAHVIAGGASPTVETIDGERLDARTVAFDPSRDVAVLHVPALDATPLPLGDHALGSTVAIYGHPGGGDLRVAPARIGEQIVAVGTDIYHRQEVRRDVLVVAAELRSGDSGAPLIDRDGRAVGVAFAIDPGSDATAYALTDSEVEAVLDSVSATTVGTGECLP
jgi:S1-C subfamily serine protease